VHVKDQIGPLLLASGRDDRTPLEQAVVSEITDGYPDETLLWINVHQPDLSTRIWNAWTAGAVALGERIDAVALQIGMDAADWLFQLADNYIGESSRGRITVHAYALRPMLEQQQAGWRVAAGDRRNLQRAIAVAGSRPGDTPISEDRPLPTWGGVGPTQVRRLASHPAC
jgi:hypothetical protein